MRSPCTSLLSPLALMLPLLRSFSSMSHSLLHSSGLTQSRRKKSPGNTFHHTSLDSCFISDQKWKNPKLDFFTCGKEIANKKCPNASDLVFGVVFPREVLVQSTLSPSLVVGYFFGLFFFSLFLFSVFLARSLSSQVSQPLTHGRNWLSFYVKCSNACNGYNFRRWFKAGC